MNIRIPPIVQSLAATDHTWGGMSTKRRQRSFIISFYERLIRCKKWLCSSAPSHVRCPRLHLDGRNTKGDATDRFILQPFTINYNVREISSIEREPCSCAHHTFGVPDSIRVARCLAIEAGTKSKICNQPTLAVIRDPLSIILEGTLTRTPGKDQCVEGTLTQRKLEIVG